MRWRAANVRMSTCAANTAISSSSSSANNGTSLSTSGLHAMVDLVKMSAWGSIPSKNCRNQGCGSPSWCGSTSCAEPYYIPSYRIVEGTWAVVPHGRDVAPRTSPQTAVGLAKGDRDAARSNKGFRRRRRRRRLLHVYFIHAPISQLSVDTCLEVDEGIRTQ